MLLLDVAAYTPVAIALSVAAAVVGAIVSAVKLRGDTNSQAVSQAQGAMETMQELLAALERDRDYWRARFEQCHSEKSVLLADRLP